MSEFRRGERVVVRRLNTDGWSPEDHWVVGAQAIVHGDYAADEVMVWLPSGEAIGQNSLWILDADLLESCGEVDEVAEERIADEASGSQLRLLEMEEAFRRKA
jgi:hypothetical protein